MTKELSDFKKEDILNSELIGNGIPDLQDELDKLKADGSQENQGEDIFGATGLGFEQEQEQEPEASCEGKDCRKEEQKEEEYF